MAALGQSLAVHRRINTSEGLSHIPILLRDPLRTTYWTRVTGVTQSFGRPCIVLYIIYSLNKKGNNPGLFFDCQSFAFRCYVTNWLTRVYWGMACCPLKLVLTLVLAVHFVQQTPVLTPTLKSPNTVQLKRNILSMELDVDTTFKFKGHRKRFIISFKHFFMKVYIVQT